MSHMCQDPTWAIHRETPVSYRTRFAEILAKDRLYCLDSFLSFYQLYCILARIGGSI